MRTRAISLHIASRSRVTAAVLVATLALVLMLGAGSASASVGEVVKLNAFGAATVSTPYGVAVDQHTGDVYLGDMEPPSATANDGAFLFQFTPEQTLTPENPLPTNVGGEGSGEGQFEGVSGVAVDTHSSPSGIYGIDVGDQRIERFNAETLAYESEFPISSAPEVQLAVDTAGIIFLPNGNNEVQELTSTGAPGPVPSITGSGIEALVEPTKVAVASDGSIYVIDHPSGPEEPGRVEEFNASGEFQSVLGGGADAIAVDPSNNDVWVVEGPVGEEIVTVYDSTGNVIAKTTNDEVLAVEGNAAKVENIAVYGATHEAFVTVRKLGVMERLKVVIPSEPTIGSEAAAAITQTTATLEANIDPQGEPTIYQFHYGLTEAFGSVAPAAPALVGSDSTEHAVSAELDGLTANTEYFYDAAAENGLGTTEGAPQSLLTAPATPATGEASEVSQTEATLSGAFNPGGHDTHYYFEYGGAACTPTSCGAKTVEEDAGSGATMVEPAAKVADLSPLTTYHYRLVVTNRIGNGGGGGTAYGPEREFVTSAPPIAITEPAMTISATSAELGGEVRPRDATTSYRVEYGLSTEYGQSAPAPEGSVNAATEGAYVTIELSGLLPSTTYHYRLVARNSSGSDSGEDRTFTTNAAGEPSNEPLPGGFSLTGSPLTNPGPITFPSLTSFGPVAPPTVVPKAPRVKITKHSYRGGALTLSISTPTSGRIVASGSGVASVKRSAAKAGTYTLKLVLTKAGAASLRKHHHLTLKVKVAFAPSSSAASSVTLTVTINKT